MNTSHHDHRRISTASTTRHDPTVWLVAGIVALLAALVPAVAATQAGAERPVCDGLTPVVLDGELRSCTHGSDDFGAVGGQANAAGAGVDGIPRACVGDGQSGPRVQLVYAHSPNSGDRFAVLEDELRQWGAGVDDVARRTSRAQGSDVVFRWATTHDCRFDIISAPISNEAADGDNNNNGIAAFLAMIRELEAQGLTDSSRKYLVYVDGTGIGCGIGESYIDDRTDPSVNNNNGNVDVAMFARVDRSCWGPLVGAHELMHTLGAVLSNAPHAIEAFRATACAACGASTARVNCAALRSAPTAPGETP